MGREGALGRVGGKVGGGVEWCQGVTVRRARDSEPVKGGNDRKGQGCPEGIEVSTFRGCRAWWSWGLDGVGELEG